MYNIVKFKFEFIKQFDDFQIICTYLCTIILMRLSNRIVS